MFGKLMKYEIKSMFKQFSFIWIAVIAVAAIIKFTSGFGGNEVLRSFLPEFVFSLVYGALLIAMVVLSIMFIIQRFYNGLLKDEGYLMFTLPVKPWQLVMSKLLTATLVTVISTLVGIISIFVLAGNYGRVFGELFDALALMSEKFPTWPLIATEIIILLIASCLETVTMLYMSMAIGHLGSKHRVALSFAAYIGINTVIAFIVNWIMGIFQFTGTFDRLFTQLATWSNFGIVQLVLITLIVITIIPTVIFYVGTERILAKKLNLE